MMSERKRYTRADLSLAMAQLQDMKERSKQALKAGQIGELVRLNERIRNKEREIRLLEKLLGKSVIEVRENEES